MEIYIAHFFTRYDNGETYAYAAAFGSREDAEKAIDAEMESALDAAGIDEDPDTTAARETAKAWARGDEDEAHDAILEYGDLTKWCDITQTNV